MSRWRICTELALPYELAQLDERLTKAASAGLPLPAPPADQQDAVLCGRATGMLGQRNVEVAVPLRNQVMGGTHQPRSVSVSEVPELEGKRAYLLEF